MVSNIILMKYCSYYIGINQQAQLNALRNDIERKRIEDMNSNSRALNELREEFNRKRMEDLDENRRQINFFFEMFSHEIAMLKSKLQDSRNENIQLRKKIDELKNELPKEKNEGHGGKI